MREIAAAIDGAEFVKVSDQGEATVVAVWHGGVTVNIYVVFDGEWSASDVFSVSDEKGRPIGSEEMKEKMNEYLSVSLADMEAAF